MTNKELLEKIAEAIEASTETVTVMVPSTCYYARGNDAYQDTIRIINPSILSDALQQLADSL